MIIHFAGPSFGIENRIGFYRRIVKLIHDLDHTLSHDWVEPAYSRSVRGKHVKTDWVEACNILERAIDQSDVVVIDAAEDSYIGVGYQIAYAVQKKKPTLILLKVGVDTNVFARGIRGDLIFHKDYKTEAQGQSATETFIKEHSVTSKDLRFNFVIDRQIYNYLKWLSFDSGKTKAEVLRDLVIQDIQKG